MKTVSKKRMAQQIADILRERRLATQFTKTPLIRKIDASGGVILFDELLTIKIKPEQE